jgi:hypothetical protein
MLLGNVTEFKLQEHNKTRFPTWHLLMLWQCAQHIEVIDQVCSVWIGGYWSSTFLRLYGPSRRQVLLQNNTWARRDMKNRGNCRLTKTRYQHMWKMIA